MLRIASAFAVFALSCLLSTVSSGAQGLTVTVDPQQTIQLPSDPRGAMQSARELVAGGNLSAAIKGLQLYVAGHPYERDPARLLGDLYYRSGDLRGAEAEYQHILSYAPDDKETHNRLGSVYAAENHINRAIREFNRSLPGTDSVPDLVGLHERRGDLPEYEGEVQYAADGAPSDAEAQLEMGQIYEATGRPQMALRYLDRAMADDGSNLVTLNYVGLAYLDQNDYAAAAKRFTECLGRDAYNFACANNLGATYLESGQYGAAQKELDFAHGLMPERSETLVNLGYLSDEHGDWKKAVSYYVEATALDPYAPDAYIDLGSDYVQHGLFALAQSALIKGLAVAPYDGRLHVLLGDAYLHQGNGTLAGQQFKAAESSFDPSVRTLARERVAALGKTALPPR